ncbi:MAG TPA: hypothetical protein PLR76_05560 [Hyphomonas sp.]|nr:hypothetical protein [Hyphomonas sp.]MCB9963054.1 hypothetical protein [Hyphomonas sp.]MCB9972445.1 hypothetical protein [Hyphomonas sp.]HPE47839.1 hypothetical protein [Hyphomonas sp.]
MKTNIGSHAPACLGLSGAPRSGRPHAETDARLLVLARIEAALARMDAGRYGLCVTCDGRIGLDRLEADPAEAVCASCMQEKPA